jgi:hypothetical protein
MIRMSHHGANGGGTEGRALRQRGVHLRGASFRHIARSAAMTDLPYDWTPKASMKRIHLHWTAGGHRANATDRRSYHLLVEGDGTILRGDRSIAANAPGSGLTPASHTLNANTGAIGLSLCAMRGAKESPFDAGPEPVTEVQWTRAAEVAALLCERYDIPVSPVTVLSHAEVQPNLGIAQRQKWDVTRLPFRPDLTGAAAVGDLFRQEVAARLSPTPGRPDALPLLRVRGVAPGRLNLRRDPSGEVVGSLAEGVSVEGISSVGSWWRVRTPGGHVGWIHGAYVAA